MHGEALEPRLRLAVSDTMPLCVAGRAPTGKKAHAGMEAALLESATELPPE